jgi:hypothetical protein
MARHKAKKEPVGPTQAGKRSKGNKASPQNDPELDTEVSGKPEDLEFVCKLLRPAVLEMKKRRPN